MKKNTDDENQKDRKKKIIIYIIIIIIIILSLITSCSCTSNFFGRIGSMFKNEKDYTIDSNTNDKETIRNEDLRFDKDSVEISLGDTQFKLSFTYENINPTQFTCSTSDANIATCYVSSGYVIVNAKNTGEVIVTLQTTTNGKIYEATSTVIIADSSRYIELSSYNGTINLASNQKTRNISYKLVGLSGTVTAKSSDENIATVTVENGKVVIIGKTEGTATITVSIEYNGHTYEKIYTVTVENKPTSSGSNNNTGTKPNKPVKPNEPSNPQEPNKPDDNNKDNDTSLKTLKVDGTSILNKYYIEVYSRNANLEASPTKSTSVIIYEGKEYKSLNDISLDLNIGENTINFKVKAEDGTEQEYTISIIRKTSGGNSGQYYNKNLEYIKINDELITGFKPNITNYTVYLDDNSKLEAKAIEDTTSIFIDGKQVNIVDIPRLNPGETKTIIIKAQAPDGTFKNYTVKVVGKSTYTLSVDNVSCDILGENPICFAKYTIYQNGIATNLVATKASLEDSSYGTIAINKNNPGELVITPNIRTVFPNILSTKINIEAQNPENGDIISSSGTLTFNYLYKVSNEPSYDIGVSGTNGNLSGERVIIIDTNLFSGTDLLINGKTIKNYDGIEKENLSICSGDNCIHLKANGPIKIAYVKEDKISNSSLAIKVVATDVGSASIDVSWSVYNKPTTENSIQINISEQYLVRVFANGGISNGTEITDGEFNAFTTVYEFKVNKNQEVKLEDFDKPYIYKDCGTYNFIHYNTDKTDSNIATRMEHKNFTPNGNMDLYAFYNSNADTTKKPTKELWLADVDLFHNEEYYNKFNKDKVIYPRATGSYTMNIINDIYESITITGMELKEESVCVDIDNDGKNDGCLNMAYIIRATDPENKNKNFYYYYGDKLKNSPLDDFENDNYQILNGGSKLPNNSALINFRNADITNQSGSRNKEIPIVKGKAASITIFWRWIDYDDFGIHDKIDTEIGKYATEYFEQNKKDLLYKLYVKIEFETSDEKCKS